MFELDEPLSDFGHDRREQILRRTILAARGRRRRKIAARSFGAVMILVLAVVPVLLRSQRGGRTVAIKIESQNLPEASAFPIEQIKTDPTIADRLSISPDPHWQQMSDDDLLQTLAAAGQPGGLVHVDGQTILVTDGENQ
jgi:hypothetical protein